jgi:RNA polymerase sigma factor for flagellar operon FliA
MQTGCEHTSEQQEMTSSQDNRPASEPFPDLSETPEQLVEKHTSLVKRIAHHLKARLPSQVQVDDLYQSGMIGLLEAARNYNAMQGACFETYAGIRIRGAMLDELRRNDWTPKSVHRKNRELAEAIRQVEARVGRDARDSEIIEQMGITSEEYHRILIDASTSNMFSLEELMMDDYVSFADGDKTKEPHLAHEHRLLHQSLTDAISGLPERERMVVTLYYDAELNLREIGEVLGVSESRTSQLMSQALARLRARLQELSTR